MTFTKQIRDFYWGQDTPQSIDTLIDWLRDAATRQVHGTRDNDEYVKGAVAVDRQNARIARLRSGMDRAVTCNCTAISTTMVDLLSNAGVPSRLVRYIAVDGQPHDLRHTVLEAQFENNRLHVDVDAGTIFSDGHGVYDSLTVFTKLQVSALGFGAVQRLVNAKEVDINYPHRADYLNITQHPGRLLAWYRHLAGGMVIDTGMLIGSIGEHQSLTLLANLPDSIRGRTVILPFEEFRQRFYTPLAPGKERGTDI